jgi:hypothetical protein
LRRVGTFVVGSYYTHLGDVEASKLANNVVDNLLSVYEQQRPRPEVAERRMHNRCRHTCLAATCRRYYQNASVSIERVLAARINGSLLIVPKFNHFDAFA